ncbi:MAG TPA: efflux RND transporter periplasmic adaptor subunit [Candidatus Kapabacteria bacterium]|nr:efflux RND transporter periplasmic adaptor subunit [Candidatus Kapabacteria bacterium]
MEQTATTPPATPSTTPTTKAVLDRMKKKKKRNRWIWIGLGVLLILIVALVIAKAGKEKSITVQTEKAAKRTITEVVQATGKVQPEILVKISPEVPGEIISLPFKEGAEVKKGDLLAEIKPTSIKAQYDAGIAQVEAAKAAIEQTKAQMITAGLALKRAKSLHDQHLASDADLEQAQAQADVATANYNAAGHNVKMYEDNLTQAAEALRKTSVLSPMDGYITTLISQLGEKVVGTSQFSGTEMMDVGDLSVMNAMVDVDENDVVNLKLGDTARVSIDAFPDRTFVGLVIEIANSAKLKGAGTQDQSTNFTVKIRLGDFQTGELRPGMSCTAKIETQTKSDIITVPIMAVTRRLAEMKSDKTSSMTDDQVAEVGKAKKKDAPAETDASPTIVFVVNGAAVKSVVVKTGISDNQYVEITDGLKGGEEIVKGNYAAVSKDLDDGKKIKIDNSEGGFGGAPAAKK